MKVFANKIWIPAAIFLIVLLSAFAVIIVFQIRINQLNDRVSDLNEQIRIENQDKTDAFAENNASESENEALKTENDTLKAQNDKLNEDLSALNQFQLTVDVPNKYEIAVDQRLDPAIVDLITRHFTALATGNIDEYRSTLYNADDDYLLGLFKSRKNTAMSLTSIAFSSLGAGIPQDGGFWLNVSYRSKGKINRYDDIGVTKKDGLWVIYAYD